MAKTLHEKKQYDDIDPRWLDLNKACTYASMSEKTLLQYINKAKDIYGTKKGGKWYIDRYSIDEFMLKDKKEIQAAVASFMEACA